MRQTQSRLFIGAAGATLHGCDTRRRRRRQKRSPPSVPAFRLSARLLANGSLQIFGHVEGELHASTVQICDGAQVEGNIVAEELTIGGRVKGTIHANRVKLNSTAVVEGDIYHRSLAIEENAQFEGMSRRQENPIETPSLVPAQRSQAQAINVNGQGDAASNGLSPSQA